MEGRLVELGHGSHPSYRRTLTVILLLLGSSLLVLAGTQAFSFVAGRAWEETDLVELWIIWGALLLLAASIGAVMMFASIRLLRLWRAAGGSGRLSDVGVSTTSQSAGV